MDWTTFRFCAVDLDGAPLGVVIAKAAFRVGEDRIPRPDAEPAAIREADVPWEGEDPAVVPLRAESDLVFRKDRADVVVLATAHAPEGKAVPSFDVEVGIGRHRRVLRIFGPRQAVYRGPANPSLKKPVEDLPRFTDPDPVRKVPVTPTMAYGGTARFRVPGTDTVMDIPCPTNPFGRGYCVQNSPEGLDGLPLPQIEDPERLLTPGTLVQDMGAPDTVPWAAILSPYGRAWYPRAAYAGVPPWDAPRVRDLVRAQADALDPQADAQAIEMLRTYEPPLLAPEFFQCGAPGLVFPRLEGDEVFLLRNLTPGGYLSFNLPGVRPRVVIGEGTEAREVPVALDTLIFDAESSRLELTFRGRLVLESPEAGEAFLARPWSVTTEGGRGTDGNGEALREEDGRTRAL
ncbi:DUF2169 domain-containing protein [Myxococcota bacterium]|nr:DUF2169 domain-containing protein [Myxococcota bacterium]